ncbi:Serine kinase, variant 2 [Orbilia ellipsospora]|uniref:non-specific serine/threonine protein kinase n=1 Tax=Orbilia ellipsospora TaxID=2528407 RepID=A0AAV9XRA7_9PEZI
MLCVGLIQVEMGSKNHEVVPTPLISQISGLRGASGVNRSISNLAKVGLIARVKNAKYDGYRLTYGGLDYLALNTFIKRKSIYSIGNQVGVGKESDIYVVADESGKQRILKIHRLGRISFRTVKANRDYLRNRNAASWMYMSRLAAMKEFAFMKVLKDNGFPVPTPIDQARHCVLMELIDSYPLRQVTSIADPPKLYADLMSLIMRFASQGLIHGDFNEFNILVHEETQEPVVIDFPQMVSIDHPNAEEYFDRDVQCIKTFFARKFGFESEEEGPDWKDVKRTGKLDVEVEASGFSKKQAKELDKYLQQIAKLNERDGDEAGGDVSDENDDDQEEEDRGSGMENEDDEQPDNSNLSEDSCEMKNEAETRAPRSGVTSV